METTEGNKLIAEFMGQTETDNDLVFNSNINGTTSNSVFSGWVKKEQEYTRGVPLFVVKNNRTQIDYMRKNLKYHSSWDWLMPVVEKCLTISVESEEYEIHYAFIHNALWSINIKSVFDEVVEFIKWYNDQKK